jgi:hypothetical protein
MADRLPASAKTRSLRTQRSRRLLRRLSPPAISMKPAPRAIQRSALVDRRRESGKRTSMRFEDRRDQEVVPKDFREVYQTSIRVSRFA